MTDIANHYCGQTQPHEAHTWETPSVYGTATFVSAYQCAGAAAPYTEAHVMAAYDMGRRHGEAAALETEDS